MNYRGRRPRQPPTTPKPDVVAPCRRWARNPNKLFGITINENGTLFLPYIGSMLISGKTIKAADEKSKSKKSLFQEQKIVLNN